jgi:hypothetical protein
METGTSWQLPIGCPKTWSSILRPSDRIEGWRVGDEARNPRNDGLELYKKVEDTKENKPK